MSVEFDTDFDTDIVGSGKTRLEYLPGLRFSQLRIMMRLLLTLAKAVFNINS